MMLYLKLLMIYITIARFQNTVLTVMKYGNKNMCIIHMLYDKKYRRTDFELSVRRCLV